MESNGWSTSFARLEIHYLWNSIPSKAIQLDFLVCTVRFVESINWIWVFCTYRSFAFFIRYATSFHPRKTYFIQCIFDIILHLDDFVFDLMELYFSDNLGRCKWPSQGWTFRTKVPNIHKRWRNDKSSWDYSDVRTASINRSWLRCQRRSRLVW